MSPGSKGSPPHGTAPDGLVLHESGYYRLTDEGEFRRLVRTSAHFPTLGALQLESETMSRRLRAAADAVPKPLLVDLRMARGRSDAEFEAAMGVWRRRFLAGHPLLVSLVGTVVGKMHVERHLADDGIDGPVLLDLVEAESVARGWRPS